MPNMAPRCPKFAPRWVQDGPKRPNTAPRRPKTAPRGRKMVLKGPKMDARWPHGTLQKDTDRAHCGSCCPNASFNKICKQQLFFLWFLYVSGWSASSENIESNDCCD